MIIGKGLIATLFTDHNREDTIFFASGVSNSSETDPAQFYLKAVWKTGIYPYILPQQRCVCDGNEGIGEEVILHVGHKNIAEYYKNK